MREAIIITNAIIWAAVILASAVVLKDTSYFGQMLPILSSGAAGSIILLGGGLRKVGER